MDAFPNNITPVDGERHTGMVCPDCGGALVVRAEGPHHHLVFRCRVGHIYGLEDMLLGKEERLEEAMWSAVYAAEELAAFLDDTGNRIPTLDDDGRRARIAHLRANARSLREVIANDRSIKLNRPAAE
jgi:hypothetical protein